MRLRIVVLCLSATVVLVAGCGGGSGSSGGGSTDAAQGKPLTKAQYIAKGEAICGEIPKSFTQKRGALARELKKKGQKMTKSEENLKAAVPPLNVAVEEFKQLVPPKGEGQKTEAVIQALEKAAKGLEEEPESGLTGPKSPFAEFQHVTSAYGLQFCSGL